MRLLFDENLSPRLAAALGLEFPGSAHVHDVDLGAEADAKVWAFARDNGFVIASKDSDFVELSVLSGEPPKLVWKSAETAQPTNSSRCCGHTRQESTRSRAKERRACTSSSSEHALCAMEIGCRRASAVSHSEESRLTSRADQSQTLSRGARAG